MFLKRNTDNPRPRHVTIFVACLLLASWLLPPKAQASAFDDDIDPRVYQDDDPTVQAPPRDDDRNLPFRPFGGPNGARNLRAVRDRNNNGDNDTANANSSGKRNQYSWGKVKERGTQEVKSNDRFGTTEGKIQFRLVHDELIKKTIREKTLEGKDISKAPLLPDLDTSKESIKE